MDIQERGRKRGRPKGTGSGYEKYQITLAPDDAEWGKRQPGGLSELMRRLLRAAREESEPGSTWESIHKDATLKAEK